MRTPVRMLLPLCWTALLILAPKARADTAVHVLPGGHEDEIRRFLLPLELGKPISPLCRLAGISIEGEAVALQIHCGASLPGVIRLRYPGAAEGGVHAGSVDVFADKQLPVRVNAARAVEQIGTDASALLLRLRAELASDEPELLGACYSGVLRLEGPSAIPWAAKFLTNPNPRDPPDAASAEAAFAIAETRTEAAAALLIATHKRARDPDFRGTLLAALALTRQDKAIDYLFDEIADGNKTAREALENSAPSSEVLERLQNLR